MRERDTGNKQPIHQKQNPEKVVRGEPNPIPPGNLLFLQKAIGNRAVGGLMALNKPAQPGSEVIQLVCYANPTRHGSQKGKFVGDPEKVHIHIVSDNTHVKYGKTRRNFDETDKESVKGAYNWLLQESGWTSVDGCTECLGWLLKTYNRL